MASTIEDPEGTDLTTAEFTVVTANEKAGLVSQLACHFCGTQFDVKKTRSLRAHIEEVHVLGDSGYMCGICCEEFTSRKAVETHMSTFHRAPKPLGCGICGETFRVRNLLLKHIDSHKKEEIENNKVGMCYCGECFEFFDSVVSLQVHSMVHKEQAVFVCGACGLQTQHRHIMIKHLETHVISKLLSASEESADIYELNPIEISASQVQSNEPSVKDETGHNAGGGEEIPVDDNATSYKCGVCHASFSNLEEALGHAENHPDDNTQAVKEIEFREGTDLCDLLHENCVAITDPQHENVAESDITKNEQQ